MNYANEVANKLKDNGVEVYTERFMNGFWGKRVVFDKRDKRKVQRLIPDCRVLKTLDSKGRLCLEYYG